MVVTFLFKLFGGINKKNKDFLGIVQMHIKNKARAL